MRHFVQRGWRVTVICPEGPRLREVRAIGVEHLDLPLSRRLIEPMGDAASALAIARLCRERRFDLVHTHNIKAGLIGRVAARAGGARRVVHTMHGMPFDATSPLPRRAGHAGLEWLACRFADRVLVQSEEDRRTLLEHHVVADAKITRIGNGVPLGRFDPARASGAAVRRELGLAPEDVLFVSAGRLVRSKGFVELAEAAGRARAADPRVRVAIAGPRDTEKADALDDADVARAEAAGVRFLGERDDMPEVYAAADVVALPSWHEGLPRVLMEGAAMAKPLLATDVRGCREVVSPEGGALVPARDPVALAGAMARLAADPDARARQGAHNRERALAEFDLDAVIRKLEAVYAELLA
jgi:glycosyltransferase involved in cell wall biosynthesis